MLLYLNLELQWPRSFSTSVWMEGSQGASLPRNLGRLRGFSFSILNCNDQRASLPRSEWKVTKGFSTLEPRVSTTKDQNLGLDFKWWERCYSTILRCMIFLSLFSLTWTSFSKGKIFDFYEVLWKFFIIHFFEICSWRFVLWKFVQEIYSLNICSWRFFLSWRYVHGDFSFHEDMFMEIFPLKISSGDFSRFEDLFRRYFLSWRCVHWDLSIEDLFRRFFLYEDVFMEIYPLKIEV